MAFVTKDCARLARRSKITDSDFRGAINNADKGAIDAHLGSGLIKQRIARPGEGKRGGFRAILFYRRSERVIFLHLFAKAEKTNLSAGELAAYRDFAGELDKLTDEQLQALAERRGWRTIDDVEPEEDVPK